MAEQRGAVRAAVRFRAPPAVRKRTVFAFMTGAKQIKPMFLITFNFGTQLAIWDCLQLSV
jgi:hypothetical protein